MNALVIKPEDVFPHNEGTINLSWVSFWFQMVALLLNQGKVLNINYREIVSLFCTNLNMYSLCIYLKINDYSKFSMKVSITHSSKCGLQAFKCSDFLSLKWDLPCLLMSWTEKIHEKLQPFACIATKIPFKSHLFVLVLQCLLDSDAHTQSLYTEGEEWVWLEVDSTKRTSKISIWKQTGCNEGMRKGMVS